MEEPSIETSKDEARSLLERQKANRDRLRATSAEERARKLRRLQRVIQERFHDLKDAVYADLRKHEAEVRLTEVYPVNSEIKHVIKHLRRWMEAEPVSAPMAYLGSRSAVRREPKGSVLILSPWNYPFNLAMGPLVSAVAAGNAVVLKPSEASPHTSRFIRRLISDLFDENEVAVIEGDHRIAQFLVEQSFDHIFFTGSPATGKKVMAAAAAHLTSVTLELGGKSPVFIDESADIDEAASKIAWGKALNAGQSCVAPDYVLVPEAMKDRCIARLKHYLRKRYGAAERIQANLDYGRIVNRHHFQRIKRLVDSAVRRGARIEEGGVFVEEDNFISPTLVTELPPDCALMEEEIFGPVLPIVSYRSRHEAIQLIRSRPRPLALYVFAREPSRAEAILSSVPAGDSVINDVVVHFGNPCLPFGGLNDSGIGKSHGKAGFEAFSHQRSVMRQPKATLGRLLYPPYSPWVRWLIRLTVKYF